MKKLMKKLEDLMVAVTFAEAGEYDEANRLAGNDLQEETAKAELKKPSLERVRE